MNSPHDIPHFIFATIQTITSSHFSLLFLHTACFLVIMSISYFCVTMFLQETRSAAQKQSFKFVILIMLSMILENIAWIFKSINTLELVPIPNTIVRFSIILAWIFAMVRYQSFGLLIESLLERDFTYKLHQKIFATINTPIAVLFAIISIIQFFTPSYKILLSPLLLFIPIYVLVLIFPSLIIMLRKINSKQFPHLIRKQILLFTGMIVLPHFIFDFIQVSPALAGIYPWSDNMTAGFFSISFMICAIYLCAQKITKFRFLNFFKKVQDKPKVHLSTEFKDAIEHISTATTIHELNFITKTFFKENFDTDMHHIHLYVRNSNLAYDATQKTIEGFLAQEPKNFDPQVILRKHKILVRDELEFDNFYFDRPETIEMLTLLKRIHACLLLPLYNQEAIIGYIVITTKNYHLFTITEQNRMIVFANYLTSAISILHNNDLQTILQENKQIKEELYHQHQELSQYKESIKSIMKQHAMQSGIGIITYKSGHFTLGNQIAQDMVQISLNQQKMHPVVTQLKNIAEKALTFKTSQRHTIHNAYDSKLIVHALPHLDPSGGAILTLQYPDASDIIKSAVDKLHDPSKWDYALYLETTESGQLINQLIPSNTETLLNFKIQLLELALTNKALVLESAYQDFMHTTEIIHKISLRKTLHVLELQASDQQHDISAKLFGINPILTSEPITPLLQKLDRGTLCIKNIEFLSIEAQEKLADFIKYGLFTITRAEQKISSDVRIICSINQPAHELISQNKLSEKLYNVLKSGKIALPSLITLEEDEIADLLQGFAAQTITNKGLANLISLNDKDKATLIDQRPASLKEFKAKVQYVLAQKTSETNIFHEKQYTDDFDITDPELLRAAQMGKHSLKDPKIMALLWNRFKNQNQIATFLGVNRSSVNRRCKEYNLV